mmetsp:Transcript_721/g.1259  ORF Transcript_721/g.1259 Transcript_721/m.1259 type:complete len:469 (+) Transcript_721:37-1443(+)
MAMSSYARACLALCCANVAQAFFEELFGGGGNVHFEMGGGHHAPPPPEWPAGVSDEASKSMSWLKGTEWAWNNGDFNLKLQRDGDFEAPIQQCRRGSCKWTAENGKLYLAVGDAGIFELDAPDSKPASLKGQRLKGHSRRNPRERLTLTFQKIYDHEAQDLDKDLYEVLGIPEDSDDATIKKVYRKLSIKYHPDKNPDEASKAKFAEIRDAYEILNDPDKKILYDTGGMSAVKDSEHGKIQTTSDVNAEIEVSLEDLYLSREFNANVQRGVVCRGCRKHPDSPNCAGCKRCKDQVKVVQVQMGPFLTQQEQKVPSKERCKVIDAGLEVHVEKGMREGDVITFPRMAEERPGMMPGSVMLKLKVKKHNAFVRRDNDLHMGMKISLRESLLGWSRTITHMDGHTVEITQKDVTKHLQVVKVKSEGMPLRDDPATFGDLHVKVDVEFPKQLTAAQKAAIAEVFPEGGRTDL